MLTTVADEAGDAGAGAETGRPRRGRRPGTHDNRRVVLEAARARFAHDGYAATTVRKIAADAGVDPSLVVRFFGSKEELFAAVMSVSADALARFAGAFDAPVESVGERVARDHLGVWEGEQDDAEALLAMLRGALVNEQANEQLRGFLAARFTEGTDARPRGDDAALRVGLASSMVMGVVLARRVVGVPTLVDEDVEAIARALAPALQAVLHPDSHQLEPADLPRKAPHRTAPEAQPRLAS
jgi:AcrR family transcriptional regulator